MKTTENYTFVVTAPGDYVTRQGDRVTVDDIVGMNSAGESVTFPVKGRIWKMFRGEMRPREFKIWQSNGRFYAVNRSPWDIVGPWVDKVETTAEPVVVRSLIGAPKVLPVIMQTATLDRATLNKMTCINQADIGMEGFDLARAASVIRLMAKELEQRRNVGEWVVTVSTAHMMESDSEKLSRVAWANPDREHIPEQPGIFWINAMPGGYLLRLGVAGDWEYSLDAADLSQEFIENCRTLTDAGYDEIFFDADGDMVDGLPSWVW